MPALSVSFFKLFYAAYFRAQDRNVILFGFFASSFHYTYKTGYIFYLYKLDFLLPFYRTLRNVYSLQMKT